MNLQVYSGRTLDLKFCWPTFVLPAASVTLGSHPTFSARANGHAKLNCQRLVGAVVDRGGWEEPS